MFLFLPLGKSFIPAQVVRCALWMVCGFFPLLSLFLLPILGSESLSPDFTAIQNESRKEERRFFPQYCPWHQADQKDKCDKWPQLLAKTLWWKQIKIRLFFWCSLLRILWKQHLRHNRLRNSTHSYILEMAQAKNHGSHKKTLANFSPRMIYNCKIFALLGEDKFWNSS